MTDVKVLQGDCRQVLKTLAADSVDCVVTSPPYYNQRNYGHPDQIGLENNPKEYVDNLLTVFTEVWRVLKPSGTLWVNLGDKYNNGNLLGLPWRFAIAMQDFGWLLHSDIIWNKTNAMPESVTNRPSKSHEYMFFFSKTPDYYYDCDVIREPNLTKSNYREKASEKHNLAVLQPIGKGVREWNNPLGRNKRSVWNVPTQPYNDAHYAVFPEKLIEPCILAGCPVGGVVLDPFGGSGTTARVATKHQRNSILIELNPEYHKQIEQRTNGVQIQLDLTA